MDNKSNNIEEDISISEIQMLEFKLALESEEVQQYMAERIHNTFKKYDIKKHIKWIINKKHKND